ncbi:MAG TPA: DNA polymerase ligase N-terminal domain-containing protein [Solirubrobacterales bacterium]|nr:DNA polymerase ligase N-terminal domain-containing protein [Solirubrobacterales bacterium]
MPRSLKEYERKRDFSRTGEPHGKTGKAKGKARRRHPRFSIQKHSATSLHYDLRLEVDGVLASWAVPKGPSLNPADKRLAMRTEDHPLEYLEWEGVIPKGEYGAGPMIVWDRGVFQNVSETRSGEPMKLSEAIEKGDVKIFMLGEKIKGAYALVRTGPPPERVAPGGAASDQREKWLLIKKRDEGADARRRPTSTQPESVLSGRTIEQVLEEEG